MPDIILHIKRLLGGLCKKNPGCKRIMWVSKGMNPTFIPVIFQDRLESLFELDMVECFINDQERLRPDLIFSLSLKTMVSVS